MGPQSMASGEDPKKTAIRDRATLSSVFLGPKAENGDLLLKLVTDVLRDYIYWRRNFHPEDPPAIREMTKHETNFELRSASFAQKLNELLGLLKRNDVPFASPRYVGHMLGDQLMPAIVGYFAAMLYNPNNVTQEVSPTTTALEEKFGEELCRVIGYDPKSSWAHLCSGGTVANLEALWVARNLKYLPLAVKIIASERQLRSGAFATGPDIGTLELWPLLNCNVQDALELLGKCVDALQVAGHAKTDGEGVDMVLASSISALGVEGLWSRVRSSLPGSVEREFPKGVRGGVVLVPATAHYSLGKVCEVLGIGRGSTQLRKVPITREFRTDVEGLKEALEECLASHTPIISVVSVLGSTEEGAIDEIHQIERLRRDFAEKGLRFFHHCDAAYGGYVATLMHTPQGEGTILPIQSRLEHPEDSLLRKEQATWPAERVREAIEAIRQADSVTIDPHKLGYVPYPAGSIAFRERRVRDVIALRPTYLEEPLIGSYILEGSKPGAAAAACWLTTQTLPLNQEGHGTIIKRVIRNAYTLADALRELSTKLPNDVRLRVINYPPDLNIVCFIFNFGWGEAGPLQFMNGYMEEVYHQFLKFDEYKALSAHEIIVSKTEFSPEEYEPDTLSNILADVGVGRGYFCRRGSNDWMEPRTDCRLFVFRCVVMNPWLGMALSEVDGPGPERAPLDRLNFIARFVRRLERYILEIHSHRAEIEKAIEAEVREHRKGKAPRLGRLMVAVDEDLER